MEFKDWVESKIEFWKSKTVIKPNGCWAFCGALHKDGYGYVVFRNKKYLLHRISAFYYLDYDLNPKKEICHKNHICYLKSCWNPDHLYIGDKFTNAQDRVEMGTQYNPERAKTKCIRGHPFSRIYSYKNQKIRVCDECTKIRNAKYRASNKRG